MAQVSGDIDRLLTHFRQNRDRVISLQSISETVEADEKLVLGNLESLAEREEIFKVGEGKYILSNNSELVAYEIFRDLAPNISFEEYRKYQDEPHVLMRMSRDRQMNLMTDFDDENKALATGGNSLK